MQTLTSAQNPLLKEVRKAVQQGTATAGGLCVAENFHLLDEALRSGSEIDAVLFTPTAAAAVESRFDGRSGARLFEVPAPLFRELSSTQTSQGVIALVRPPAWTIGDLFGGRALIVYLDGIQEPGNAGAILRAGEAFGATGVAFGKGTVTLLNPKAVRASAGSVFRLPWAGVPDEDAFLQDCERRGVVLYALMPDGARAIHECDLAATCALIAGSEGRGIRKTLAARAIAVRIPVEGVESLNAAMAAGVALYEARRQRTFHHEPVRV